MNENDYYVYEHYRLDNGDTFYVGKGHGKRMNYGKRNSHHDRIANKYGMGTRIIYDGLTEEEAYDLERFTIISYVQDLGYSIDINGYRNDNTAHCLTNHTFGGDGSYGMVHSDEWCKQHSEQMSGSNNPMYGVNLWETYSDEKSQMIKSKLSKSFSGENNPMYGVSPQERMSPEKYEDWLIKITERGKSLTGENNPNYNNDTLKKKLEDNPELKKIYYSRAGSQNGRCRAISILDDDGNVFKSFDYIGECAEWVKDFLKLDAKIDSIRANITQSIKHNKKYHGLLFRFDN